VSKTIGAKVPDEMYERIANIGPISDIVKRAVVEYLERRGCNGNSVVNHTVNRNVFEDRYQTTKREVDRFLEQLGKKS
jgi:hypothetical protein